MASENGPRRGLLIDWGGVLTTNLFSAFGAFCEAEGLDPATIRTLFRGDPAARALLVDFECGHIDEDEFQPRLCAALGLAPDRAATLIDGLFAGAQPDHTMIDAVRAAHTQGIRTGLISNSWGTRRYPHDLLGELFDAVVISGEEGMRKPAVEMYELGAKRVGLAPSECVFVDDLPFNLDPARELGMAVVHHTDAAQTVTELERILGVKLAP